MDHTQLDHYRQVIETILNQYASLTYSYADIQSEVVFDRTRDRYLWMLVGMANVAFMAVWFMLTSLMVKSGFNGMALKKALLQI